MKITFILPGYPWRPVGGFRVVYEYANYLVARGHEVTVIHPRRLPNWNPPPPPNFYRWLRRKAGHLHSHLRDLVLRPKVEWQPVDPKVKLFYVPTLDTRYISDADAVVATAWHTAEYVETYPPTKGEKFYLIQHYETWDGPKERVDATWKSSLHKIVIAKWLLALAEELGVQDVVYIPNAIDHKVFRLTRPIDDRPQQISMMFSQAEWKGPADGLRALSIIHKQFPEASAVLFGVGRRPSALPQWIQYVQNPPQDVLVNDIYNRSSIFLCPSWLEGWGLPGAEAMACGCALVSTDNGGVLDYAEHEKTALLSPPKNPEALAKNLLRVLEDDNLRIQLARAGHERIKEFTWDRSTDLLEQFLRQHV